MTSRFWFCIILFLFAVNLAFAQTGEVRGFAYDKEDGEAITFANVFLEGTSFGTATDINGFYRIPRILPGTYTLISRYLGYDTFKVKILVAKDRITHKNIYLQPSALELSEIKITDKGIEHKTEVKVSQLRITPREIARLPSVGATPDLAQYIQILPGVVTSGDKGGQIFIRGGTPIQSKVIIDGMTIYNPFHSIGLFSVFDIDIIRNIDVYAGGFDAEYGGRISAIMDIKTIDGNKKRFAGKVSMSPFLSNILLKGPIRKWEENQSHSTFLFSARSSYLDKTSKILYDYADSNGLPYSFNDFYGKISFVAPGGSKANFFGFSFNDLVNFQDITKYNWKQNGGGAQFLLVPAASSTLIEGNFSYSDYKIEQSESDNRPRHSYISGFEGSMNFSYFLGKDLLKYGFELSGYKTEFQFYNSANRVIKETTYSTNLSGFFKYKKIINKFIFVPSIRLQHYGRLHENSIEPRIGVKYLLSDYFRIKFAGGLYSQDLISSFSDRDVVNLFYGILNAPYNIPNEFDGQDVNTYLQKAAHVVLGMEIEIGDYSMLNIEGYLKDFYQMTNINRNKIFDDNPHFADQPEYLKSDYIIEKGEAYGIDFHYTIDKNHFYFWFVYSLAYVTRYDGIVEYVPNWDRRHNLQILGNYIFGKKHSFEASARWNYGSSFPFTKTQGFYEYIDFSGGINEDYTTINGELGILYGELNAGRLPVYHRLDISLKKTFNFHQRRSLQLVFSTTNVYNWENIFYFDRVKSVRINQLPIIPSFGASYKF